MKKKTLLSWSSGKDSAWMLHLLKQDPDIEIAGLFSTINNEFNRIAMHSTRAELAEQQAECAGLPIKFIPLPYPCTNVQYEAIMNEFIKEVKREEIEYFAFGDLYLESVRNYREKNLAGTGITPLFPLWKKDTKKLSSEMIDAGLKAIVTCIDPKCLPKEFAGRNYDKDFLQQIPAGVDPCGENGEFHSFVFAGPMFHKKIDIRVGETVTRDGFVFTDIIQDE